MDTLTIMASSHPDKVFGVICGISALVIFFGLGYLADKLKERSFKKYK